MKIPWGQKIFLYRHVGGNCRYSPNMHSPRGGALGKKLYPSGFELPTNGLEVALFMFVLIYVSRFALETTHNSHHTSLEHIPYIILILSIFKLFGIYMAFCVIFVTVFVHGWLYICIMHVCTHICV